MKIRIFAMMAVLLLCSACGTAADTPTETVGITNADTAETEAATDYLDTLPVYDLSAGSIRIAANSQEDRPNLHAGVENLPEVCRGPGPVLRRMLPVRAPEGRDRKYRRDYEQL